MIEYNKEKHKFFGEWTKFSNEEEKIKAREYLNYWKKDLIFKLKRDSFDVKIVDEQWVERDPSISGMFNEFSILALKIMVEADWHYELGKS